VCIALYILDYYIKRTISSNFISYITALINIQVISRQKDPQYINTEFQITRRTTLVFEKKKTLKITQKRSK